MPLCFDERCFNLNSVECLTENASPITFADASSNVAPRYQPVHSANPDPQTCSLQKSEQHAILQSHQSATSGNGQLEMSNSLSSFSDDLIWHLGASQQAPQQHNLVAHGYHCTELLSCIHALEPEHHSGYSSPRTPWSLGKGIPQTCGSSMCNPENNTPFQAEGIFEYPQSPSLGSNTTINSFASSAGLRIKPYNLSNVPDHFIQDPLSPTTESAGLISPLGHVALQVSPNFDDNDVSRNETQPTRSPMLRKKKKRHSPSTHQCKWEVIDGKSCDEVYGTPEALHTHIKRSHLHAIHRVPFSCQWAGCVKAKGSHDFTTRTKLDRHVRVHAQCMSHFCQSR